MRGTLRRVCSALACAAAAVAAICSSARAQEEITCLTGNARGGNRGSRVRGTYSVLMPGLAAAGWPAGRPQRDVPFASGILTDGDEDTFLEWQDREFGLLGRDVVVELDREYHISRVEIYCKGNRLTGGTLSLRPEGARVFIPVRTFGRDDFPTAEDKRRGRYEAVLFRDLDAVTRHLRVNVRGSHMPRLAELQLWGRAVRAGDSRQLTPLLPYDHTKLTQPRPVAQVEVRRGLEAIVPRPRAVTPGSGVYRGSLRRRLGHLPASDEDPNLTCADLNGSGRGGGRWERPGGYRLAVSVQGIELTGFDAAGLLHGRQTLAQIVAKDGTVPCCRIEDWPRFGFRGVRKGPPNSTNKAFNERYVRAVAALKFNRVAHEGLSWAVEFASWKTGYGKAITVEELKEAIRFKESLGIATSGGWGIAPATWVTMLRDPKLVEGRPGEVHLNKRNQIDFRRYPDEVLHRLGRVNACPLQPRNLEIYKRMVDEICSIYTDEYFFGGVDEPLQWYNGSRWGCCELCRSHDPIALMADWVNACSDHIRTTHGRIHMYQTTIILKEHQGEEPGYPGGPAIAMYKIIDRMPKERTALVNWSYGSWRKRHNAKDSSGLNRYLASKGYRQIIQNVGYTDASFAICSFTDWAGTDGADFIGAFVANYEGQELEAMGRSFKFLDYVVAAEELWSPHDPDPSSGRFASQLVNGVELVRQIMEGAELPSRTAGANEFFAVDLSAHANRSAVDEQAYDGAGWLDLGPGLDLRALPSGTCELCGHRFELLSPPRSCVMIQHEGREGSPLPSEVTGIRVGAKAASLLFLHTLTDAMEQRSTGAAFEYRVRYEDGSTVSIPVRYRIEVTEWLDQSSMGRGQMRIGWFLYGARPAWLGVTSSGRRVILHSAEWVNPHPEKTIGQIDMLLPPRSQASGAALFAISGVRAR